MPTPKNRGTNPKKVKRKKKNLWLKFFMIVASIVGSFLLVVSVAAVGYVKASNAFAQPHTDKQTNQISKNEQDNKKDKEEDSSFLLPPKKTNFLLMGLDQGGMLSDVNIVGSFDREKNEIHLISLPRDTYVKLTQEKVQQLRNEGFHPPSTGEMKLNAVHSWAGKELGATYMQSTVEDLLGIKIDFYAEINIEAFQNIVDAVGGVDMEIPDGGLYYYDPTQKLKISVPGGMQHLDGKMAEGVVRYRATYRRGDLQRIDVQQEFLKQMFKQVLNKDTLMSNAPSLIKTIVSYTKTNFNIADVPKYIKYVDQLKPEQFETHVLPGEPQMINGASYYLIDEEETTKLVNKVFYDIVDESELEAQSGPMADAALNLLLQQKDFSIQVLNGGITKGMAGKVQDKLEQEGFRVDNIGTYSGEQIHETRILTKNVAMAQVLKPYFTNVVIEQDNEIADNYDVVVIIGLDEE